jgi:3-hydroxyisobutyrate dehydrogenase-like beta-hydroxyacid dehydrogenase
VSRIVGVIGLGNVAVRMTRRRVDAGLAVSTASPAATQVLHGEATERGGGNAVGDLAGGVRIHDKKE